MINSHNEFEVTIFTHYEDMKVTQNVEFAVVWWAKGHSRSLAMSPFDKAHTTLMEALHLSCTIFELYPVICQKLPILMYPPAFRTAFGVTPFKFHPDFWYQKSRFPGLSRGVVCLMLSLAVLTQYWSKDRK